MNNFNRNKDLTTVFNERFFANNNNNIKEIKKQEKEFNNKMFGNNSKYEKIGNSPLDRVNRLNERISNQNNINRIASRMDFKNNLGR